MHGQQSELPEVLGQVANRKIADLEPLRDVRQDVLGTELTDRVTHRDLVVGQRTVQAQRILRVEVGKFASAHRLILPSRDPTR